MANKKVKTVLINDRYLIDFAYPDGVIYDTVEGKDIPMWVFELRNKIVGYNPIFN